MASLSGGHTIGWARCSVIASRLYNVSNSGQADPTMGTSYLHLLQSICGPSSTTSSSSALVNLDVSTADTFDNKYYKNLRASKGLLASGQVLLSTPGVAQHFCCSPKGLLLCLCSIHDQDGQHQPFDFSGQQPNKNQLPFCESLLIRDTPQHKCVKESL